LNSLVLDGSGRSSGIKIWPVGVLLRAIADALEARFNPVAVQGEISGFSRAASGHCYFSLKDDDAQIRCAMFKRAAGLLDFDPRDGQRVEVRGRLGVYDARGELQLVVESMQQAGQGTLFEQFLKLKAKLESEGLFSASRKRDLPLLPKAIGVITSLGAAALHDVLSTLQRRAPHIPVVIYPATVQGAQSAAELRRALNTAYQRNEVDVLLLVRGGGAMEDLWAFNDEQLARLMVQSPMPIVSGVGHETDFTIADFCADVRAPTPTAAAELCAQPQQVWLNVLESIFSRLQSGVDQQIQANSQRLDLAAARVGRPSHFVTRQQARLAMQAQRFKHAQSAAVTRFKADMVAVTRSSNLSIKSAVEQQKTRLASAQLRLELLNPHLVLERGYAWLVDSEGRSITQVKQTRTGQAVRATLTDGAVDLTVSSPRLI
jgi:exodeoxyribonuclease VII large subunit